jgi:hypothetical protein
VKRLHSTENEGGDIIELIMMGDRLNMEKVEKKFEILI